jgi:hypothetical protein
MPRPEPDDMYITKDGQRLTLEEMAARMGQSPRKFLREQREIRMMMEVTRRQKIRWLTHANGDGRMAISGVPWGYRRFAKARAS